MPPFNVLLQYLLPKQALTSLAGRVASARGGSATTWLVRWFVNSYGVNMQEAAEPDVTRYASFNDFFVRSLAAGTRPIADADLVCPVDGAISQCGVITGNAIFQAKGHEYTTLALAGGDATLASQFTNGTFATLYLSPKHYHRVHMPCAGRLLRMIHVPGDLFSVNPTTARGVPGLFARNERVVCLFEGEHGPFLMVLVGATIVGSVATAWQGTVTPPRSTSLREWTYADRTIHLAKGDEMGRFLLGSTVVLLFPAGRVAFDPSWRAALPVRMGTTMGSFTHPAR